VFNNIKIILHYSVYMRTSGKKARISDEAECVQSLSYSHIIVRVIYCTVVCLKGRQARHLPRDPFATVMCKVSYFERGPTAYAYEAGGREGGRPPVSNISGKSLFSGQTQVAQKS